MRLRRLSLSCVSVVAAICTLPAAPAIAGPGDLDPTFGNGGKATFDLGRTDATEGVADLALQADGKILATGTFRPASGGRDIATLRVSPQGSQDTSFGGAPGFSQLNYSSDDSAGGLLAQPDGKIDVVGAALGSGGGSVFALARLNSSGLLDSSFNSAGTPGFLVSKFTNLGVGGSNDQGKGIAAQGGNLIVAGFSNLTDPSFDFAVSRVLSPDGTLDDSFGSSGGAFLGFGTHTADFLSAVAVQPDGKIVAVGSSDSPGGAVARFQAGGAPDTSFDSDGKLTVSGRPTGVLLQPDGKIVIVGINALGSTFVLRLKADGSPDNSFAGDGRTALEFGAFSDEGPRVALQPDGKLVVAGGTGDPANNSGDFAVGRLQPNGNLDSTFAEGGVEKVNLGPANYATSLAIQPDGKIVAGGLTGPPQGGGDPKGDFALIRLQGDPGGTVKKAKCGGKKATIIGTNGRNKLKGTKKRDVIAALGGKDTVKGLKGNDLICGGKGRDKLLGGPGNDKLLGEAGKDILRGGPGKDKVKGGAGKDVETP